MTSLSVSGLTITRGKTLTLRALMGLLPDGHGFSGSVRIGSAEHAFTSEEELRGQLERSVGVVLQNPFEVLGLYPSQLSGGMAQQIAIAMAMAPTTPVDSGATACTRHAQGSWRGGVAIPWAAPPRGPRLRGGSEPPRLTACPHRSILSPRIGPDTIRIVRRWSARRMQEG
jgi:hypothetical protein